jgi:signal transduction histidine kinase
VREGQGMRNSQNRVFKADILIVDDTIPNLELLSKMLTGEGYKVRAVPSGAMALTAAQSAPPDLVLLDIAMPDLDGYEVCLRLKDDDRTRNIPILFISALDDEMDKVRAFEVGGVDYIIKPFQAAEVVARIETHLNLQRLQDRLSRTNVQLLAANEQLIQARDEALRANQAKSVFLANMSHELRTPLNAILGYTELLQEEVESAGLEQYASDLKKIHNASMYLITLVNDILDLAKIEAGKTVFRVITFDVKQVVMSVLTTERTAIEKNNNAFTTEIDPTLSKMMGDETKVQQILFNLLSNAAKFTSNGEVSFNARQIETNGKLEIEFRVADTGIGMSPEQIEKLFDPFVQADESITTTYGGTGLGLALTKQLCQLMGGSIQVSSVLNVGTTFVVNLPLRNH